MNMLRASFLLYLVPHSVIIDCQCLNRRIIWKWKLLMSCYATRQNSHHPLNATVPFLMAYSTHGICYHKHDVCSRPKKILPWELFSLLSEGLQNNKSIKSWQFWQFIAGSYPFVPSTKYLLLAS